MMARLPHALWLIAVWVALWGDLTVANVLGGALVAAVVLWLFPEAAPRPAAPVRLLAALRYLAFFARALIQSNLEVAAQVLRPRPRIAPGIVAVRLADLPDAVVTLIANSITLTPGTLTLQVERGEDGCVLHVHALDASDPESVRADVHALERLAVDAFAAGTPAQGGSR